MPKPAKKRYCRTCDKPFPVTRQWREFCSDVCRKEFHRTGGAVSLKRIRLLMDRVLKKHDQEIREWVTKRFEKSDGN